MSGLRGGDGPGARVSPEDPGGRVGRCPAGGAAGARAPTGAYPTRGCPRTFREPLPGVLERYQRLHMQVKGDTLAHKAANRLVVP